MSDSLRRNCNRVARMKRALSCIFTCNDATDEQRPEWKARPASPPCTLQAGGSSKSSRTHPVPRPHQTRVTRTTTSCASFNEKNTHRSSNHNRRPLSPAHNPEAYTRQTALCNPGPPARCPPLHTRWSLLVIRHNFSTPPFSTAHLY